jgi:hypothetical protein
MCVGSLAVDEYEVGGRLFFVDEYEVGGRLFFVDEYEVGGKHHYKNIVLINFNFTSTNKR